MAHQKAYFSVIIIVVVFLLLGCKKRLQKKPTTVIVEIINPVTGEGYGNIHFKVEENLRNSSGIFNHNFEPTEDSPVYEGTTNSDGQASFQFKKKKGSDYMYALALDFSEIKGSEDDYKISGGSYHILDEYQHDIKINIVPYGKYYVHIKDTSCTTSNDKMRYKTIKTYYLNATDNNFGSWTPNDYFDNCWNSIANEPYDEPIEYRITKMEVIRDGQQFIYLDTFLNTKDKIDTLKLYY